MLINYINEELRVESEGSYLLSVTIGYTSFDKVIKNIDDIDENSLEKIIKIADEDLRKKKRNKNLVRQFQEAGDFVATIDFICRLLGFNKKSKYVNKHINEANIRSSIYMSTINFWIIT